MRPQREFARHYQPHDNDCRAKVFETFEGGSMVTAVKVFRRPVKLWLTSADGGALATLTVTPREGGGVDLALDADRTKSFTLQGLEFERVDFELVGRAEAASSFAGAERRPLDPGALAAEETAPTEV